MIRLPESGFFLDLVIWIISCKMWSVSFRWHLLQFAPNFRATFAESRKMLWRVYMKVRFKVSSLKFVRFFVESGDFIGSRKSETLRRSLKVKRPSKSTRRKVNTSQIPLSNLFILFRRSILSVNLSIKVSHNTSISVQRWPLNTGKNNKERQA